MEIPDNLTASLPYTFLAVVPASLLLFLLLKKRRRNHPRTRNCPHCRAAVGAGETECASCHRKIAFA